MINTNTKMILESEKAHWFIEHIKKHLKKDEKVICTICDKDVDTIAEETLNEILKEIRDEQN